MRRTEFLSIVESAHQRQLEIMRVKGDAYSGSDDVFANFKRNAERLGLTQYQIWLVYFAKHVDSVFTAIKTNPSAPVDKSEGLEGRIDDIENYCKLLRGMLNENRIEVAEDSARPPNYGYKVWKLEDTHDAFIVPEAEYQLANSTDWFVVGLSTKVASYPKGTLFRRKLDRF